MKEFQSYSPEEAIEENLRELAARMELVGEQEIAHLYELAAEIASNFVAHPDWLGSLPDHSPPKFSPTPTALPQNRQALSDLHRIGTIRHSVLLCKEIGRRLNERVTISPAFFFSDSEPAPKKELYRVAYQRNSYADNAFLQFSEHQKNLRVSYTHSFQSACEDVYNGICDFCILPVESAAEGQLNSVSRLIKQFDLKIAASCGIIGSDPLRSTRFALLRKQLTPLLNLGKEVFLEFSVPLVGSPSVSELLFAAELCGMTLHRLDTLPDIDEPNRFSVHILLQTEKADLCAYLLYLAMEAPHYNPIGIYSHIS